MLFSNSNSRRYLRWLVFGSSTYCVYACVAEFIAALISSLIWNWNKVLPVVVLLVFPVVAQAADEQPLEYRVKANYLLTLPLFVELPPHPSGCSSFTICTIGDTPLADLLDASKGKRIKGRPLAVARVHEPDRMGCCQVLFIASSEQYRLQKLLAVANRRGILTVSDMRGFVKQGGMINLVLVNNKISFDLNQAVARSAFISFGTQLLRLANDVSN